MAKVLLNKNSNKQKPWCMEQSDMYTLYIEPRNWGQNENNKKKFA